VDVDLFIDHDGSITFVYSDEVMQALGDLGPAVSPRASHVESPDGGKHWTADMQPLCGQPVVLGPFPSRAEALAAEHDWLLRHLSEPTGELQECRQQT
jgi:hypothetical protein